jgi:hypothetical protein
MKTWQQIYDRMIEAAGEEQPPFHVSAFMGVVLRIIAKAIAFVQEP